MEPSPTGSFTRPADTRESIFCAAHLETPWRRLFRRVTRQTGTLRGSFRNAVRQAHHNSLILCEDHLILARGKCLRNRVHPDFKSEFQEALWDRDMWPGCCSLRG